MFPIRDINPTRITPVLTVGLILINAAVFFFWQPRSDVEAESEFLYERAVIACELTTGEALSVPEISLGECRDGPESPLFPDKNVWLAAIVSMFLHGGIFHLAGNMWFLWIFGNNIEEAYGTLGFLAMYLASGIAGTAAFVIVNPDLTEPLVGASGAIAGVLGAYLVLYPRHRILSLFFVFFVQIPAIVYLGIWFLSQFAVGDVGVAWEAHVGGFLFGIALTLPLRIALTRRVRSLHDGFAYRF